jgi:hypothetical protein
VVAAWAGRSLLILLESQVLLPDRCDSIQEAREHGVIVVKRLMTAFFQSQRQSTTEDRVYTLNRLTPNMLGKLPHKPWLKAKDLMKCEIPNILTQTVCNTMFVDHPIKYQPDRLHLTPIHESCWLGS